MGNRRRTRSRLLSLSLILLGVWAAWTSAETLEDLELKLLDENLEGKTEAVKSLCASRDGHAVKLLLVCLQDEDLKNQSQAIVSALDRLVTADHTDLLAEELKHARKGLAAEGGWPVRKALVRLLGRTGNPKAARAILPELDSPQAGSVSEALTALAAVGSRDAIPAIREKLARLPELDAHLTLARLGEADAVIWLLKCWEKQLQKIVQYEKDPRYARLVASLRAANRRIANLVRALPAAQTSALISGALGTECAPVLDAALERIRQVTTPENCHLVVSLLDHTLFQVRKSTLALLRKLGDAEVLAKVRQRGARLMADERPAQRVEGVWLLGMLTDDPTPVVRAVRDSDPNVQRAAIEVAGERRFEAAIPVLEDLSEAANWDVRLAARTALLQLGRAWPREETRPAFEREVKQLLEGTRGGGAARNARVRQRLKGNVSKFDFLQGYPIHEKPGMIEPFFRALKARGCTAYDLMPVDYLWNQYHFDLLRRLCEAGRELGLNIWATLVPPSGCPELGRMSRAQQRLWFLTVVEEFGRIAREFPNFIAYTCDDFVYDRRLFSPRMLAEMGCLTRKSAPDLAFLPLCYWGCLSQEFFDSYHPVLDGVVFHFRCGSGPAGYIPGFDLANFDHYAACMRHELRTVRARAGDKPVICGIYIWYTRDGWGVNFKKDGKTQPEGKQTTEHVVRDAALKARVAHELSDGLRIYGLSINDPAYQALGQEVRDRGEAGLFWSYFLPLVRKAPAGESSEELGQAIQSFVDRSDWLGATQIFLRGQVYDDYFRSPEKALRAFLHFGALTQKESGLTRESGNETRRLFSALLQAAPPSRSLRGVGLLAAREFAWLPEKEDGTPVVLNCTTEGEGREFVIEPQQAGAMKGWLALDVEQMCDPFTVFAPDGSKQPARVLGGVLIVHVSGPGTWRVQGLPRTGELTVPGQFTCQWFRVKFANGLKTHLDYEFLPARKTFHFECDDLEVDERGELAVHVGLGPGAFAVKEDGEAFSNFERCGEYLQVKGVRVNVTYEIRRPGIATTPGKQ